MNKQNEPTMTDSAITLEDMLAEPRTAPTTQEITLALYAVRGYERREPDWFLTPHDIRTLAAGMVQYALLRAALDALREAMKGCGQTYHNCGYHYHCGERIEVEVPLCGPCALRRDAAITALIDGAKR